MREDKVFSIFASSFLIWMLFSFPHVTVTKAQPQEVDVGVNVGDWVKYGRILISWNSTDPNAKPDRELIELNNTEWFKNVVTDIDYPLVYFQHITRFRNGTQKTSILQIDITTGLGNGTLYFIPVGLFAADMLYPYSVEPYPVLVNITTLRVCAGVTRLVNHLNLTKVQLKEDGTPQSVYVSINYYWDRETGILTERLGVVTNNTGGHQTHWTRSDKVVDTNLWGGEEAEPPKAVAGGNQTVYKGSSVVFDASTSVDNVGIVSYHWVFGDGTTGDGIKVTHVYAQTGTFVVILIVKDGSGNMAFDTLTVVVENPPEDSAVEPPPENESGFEAIGAATVIVVLLTITWMLWSRKKRRVKLRPRKHG
jgi:hypothetical protein